MYEFLKNTWEKSAYTPTDMMNNYICTFEGPKRTLKLCSKKDLEEYYQPLENSVIPSLEQMMIRARHEASMQMRSIIKSEVTQKVA